MSRATLLLRLGVLALVVLALLDPRLASGGRAPPALHVLDLSASMGPVPTRPPGAPGDAEEWVAVADGSRWVPFGSASVPFPRAASALGAALADVARRRPGRDVDLSTDGRATDDALAGARAVRAAGGRLFVRLPEHPAADVGLLEARARRVVGGPVELDVRLSASAAGPVRLVLTRGERPVADMTLALEAGTRRVLRLTDAAPPEGLAAYTLRLVPLAGTPDDDPGNDALALGVPPARPAVLLWGEPLGGLPSAPEGPWVESALHPTPGAVDAADLVVLLGEPWARIGVEGVETLVRFVAGGGRLLVLGGREAYGPGGWGGTPFERALLPLVVRVPPGSEVDWVVALDVSGSTEGEPLRALVASAREALRGLQPGERLGILPFTGRPGPGLLAPGFVGAGDAAAGSALEVSLDALVGGGETDLAQGVGAAIDLLSAGPAGRQRRLLLLTDGDPDRVPTLATWRALAARLEAAKVRLAALVYGGVEFLDVVRTSGAASEGTLGLAGAGGLAFHTLRGMASQRTAAERERLGGPQTVDAALGTWADLLPPGFRPAWVHDVEPEAQARLTARARWTQGALREAPFAAERTVGAGLVAALAWGPTFERDPEQALRALVPMVERLLADADRGLAADLDDEGRVTVRVPQAQGLGRLLLVGVEPPTELLEVAPALFQSGGPAPEVDGLRLRAGAGAAFRERTLRLPTRPALEHRGSGPDLARMAALAEAGGGRVLDAHEAGPVPPRAPTAALAPWLLLAACILWVWERART